jgi:ATP-dependent protease HslVU (ClpYQ) peptidase subunit
LTTIAFRSGILAGDTRVSDDETIDPADVIKVFKLSSGTLIGFAGTLAKIQKCLRELKKDPEHINIPADDETECIVVYSDGKVRILDPDGWVETEAKYYAIGSGRIPALVAMRCGKSARQAVKIAMDFDKNTGGKIKSVQLGATDAVATK